MVRASILTSSSVTFGVDARAALAGERQRPARGNAGVPDDKVSFDAVAG